MPQPKRAELHQFAAAWQYRFFLFCRERLHVRVVGREAELHGVDRVHDRVLALANRCLVGLGVAHGLRVRLGHAHEEVPLRRREANVLGTRLRRRRPPRRAKASRVEIDIGAAVASARDELTVEARNELRLQGAVEEIRESIRADADAQNPPSYDSGLSGGVRRARILRLLQKVLAQINSHIRKQAAGREFRYNVQTLLCGNEAINGPLSFAVGDCVAVVCVSKHSGRVVYYADYGIIPELTVASRRGTADHSRAKAIGRTASGAKFRLHFFSRVSIKTAL